MVHETRHPNPRDPSRLHGISLGGGSGLGVAVRFSADTAAGDNLLRADRRVLHCAYVRSMGTVVAATVSPLQPPYKLGREYCAGAS